MLLNKKINSYLVGLIWSILAIGPLKAEDASRTGTLIGRIFDAETRESIGWVTLYLPEINRSIISHEDGTFHFFELPPGRYSLKVFRVGYKDHELVVVVKEQLTTTVTINLQSSVYVTETIQVQADKFDEELGLRGSKLEISGKKLRQSLGRTIAETIDYEPGLSQRTMGPAPARPILRGLGGDRLLILEDGQRTGDLSGTAADHAVVVEPVNAQRIEVVRGPQALIYGANTLGGVINIIREYIPNGLPHQVSGTASLQGESVNQGYVSGINATVPVGTFAFQADASYRRASDIHTPRGILPNTDIITTNYSLGGGFYQPLWYSGFAFSQYQSAYGIPPDPYGGHPKGVDIEMDRRHHEFKAVAFPAIQFLRKVQFDYSYSRYYHKEIESSGYVGGEFGVLTHNVNLISRFDEKNGWKNGLAGIWLEYRDYASGGLNYTPNTIEKAAAVFLYQEWHNRRFSVNGALRYDYKDIKPDRIKYSPFIEGTIRPRRFEGLSASASARYQLKPRLFAGIGLMRSFRAPGVEELFSEGPHSAAYAYEVGNANLGSETGFALEMNLEYKGEKGSLNLAAFRNDMDQYIFPKDMNKQSPQRNDLRLYRYVAEHVLMYGFEVTYERQIMGNFRANALVNYVYADLVNRNQAMPRIPPLEGKINVRYEVPRFMIGTTVRAADRQNRLGEFEQSTAGYVVMDVQAHYLVNQAKFLHTIVLSLENIGNTTYRKHLNRIKEVMPEAGRNVKLLYRLYF